MGAMSSTFPMVPLSRDKIVIVTGANSGTGYEIAKWNAMLGATVVMACRSEVRAKEAMDRMNQQYRDLKAKGTQGLADYDTLALEYMPLDLGSFKSVIQFCEDFKKSGRNIQILFANAGLGMGPLRRTEDDFEETLQVNYLSHFIMIAKLIHIVRRSGPDCRILLMSSAAHMFGTFDLSTMNYKGPESSFSSFGYYARSKLYQIMQVAAMVRRLEGSNITCFAIHPGWLDTRFAREISGFFSFTQKIGLATGVIKSVEAGVKCSIDLCVNPKYAGSAVQYWGDGPSKANKLARNVEKQEQLWTKTLQLVDIHLTQEEKNAMEGKFV